MQTYTYVSKGFFKLMEKPKPVLVHEKDAIVKVTLASIPVTFTLSTEAFQEQFRALQSAMRWLESWKKLEVL